MSSRKFADSILPLLEKYNRYTEKDRIIAHYGLETLYILITKTFIITIISLFLGITKQMYIFFIIYGFLRHYAHGLHLSSSFMCLIISSTIFLIITYLSIYTNMYIGFRLIIAGLTLCALVLYSPADTFRKPLIRKDDRFKKKLMSILVWFIYFFLIIVIEDIFILNVITFSLLLQSVMIAPITYKICKQTYNNYLIFENIRRKGE